LNDDLAFDDIERFLHEARILALGTFARHGAHPSFLAVLAGGVGVLAKPEDTIGNGAVIVGREVAAWTIARELGWGDLVSATVRRTIESPTTGQPVAASLQILWPDARPVGDPALFSDDDIWRAAVFDAVVAHEDRNTNNWLLVPDSGASPPMLKLVDHGYAFGPGMRAPNSSFFAMRQGDQIPEGVQVALGRLAAPRQSRDLDHLLEADALQGVQDRAAHLGQTGTLDL
jgi:hypothetical protein